jgi:NAD+ synthase (glutamine-hydrolysing)
LTTSSAEVFALSSRKRPSGRISTPAFPSPLPEDAEIYRALVVGTRDYVHKNGFKRVVLGLSGGIDSALTACIAADALGSESVVGVLMPSEFSSPGSVQDSEQLGKNLGIELLTIPISNVFDAYKAGERSRMLPKRICKQGSAETI